MWSGCSFPASRSTAASPSHQRCLLMMHQPLAPKIVQLKTSSSFARAMAGRDGSTKSKRFNNGMMPIIPSLGFTPASLAR